MLSTIVKCSKTNHCYRFAFTRNIAKQSIMWLKWTNGIVRLAQPFISRSLRWRFSLRFLMACGCVNRIIKLDVKLHSLNREWYVQRDRNNIWTEYRWTFSFKDLSVFHSGVLRHCGELSRNNHDGEQKQRLNWRSSITNNVCSWQFQHARWRAIPWGGHPSVKHTRRYPNPEYCRLRNSTHPQVTH